MNGPNGTLDGRVELKGVLGAGGMGEVCRAWDRVLARAVAVKFFHGTSPREAERLLLEGRLQARVDHPHVVRVLDAGVLGGRPCLVLQLVEGRSLEVLAPELSMGDRVELVRQAALGVHAAHLQGLVHRDVKPANILVEQLAGAPQALVSDFGLARGDEPGLTRSGAVAGTLAFMSPEQLVGGPVGFAADVYGLGATLFWALAEHAPLAVGRTPASPVVALGPSRGALELRPLRPLPKHVPAPLARVVAKAMEPQPGARYESAEALATDLARFQKGEPVSARPPSWAERALAWRRRNRAAAGALAAAGVVLLLSLGWDAWSAKRAALEALEAARLGALGEAMEAELRLEYLSPAHDVRPARARLRAQVEALRSEADHGGAASFALGKGLELLGDVEGARVAYERAWAKGLRSASVAKGLGSALGEQYRQGRQRAFETLEVSAREARLSTLRAELLEPAVRVLSVAGVGGTALRASMALWEGDFAGARRHAAEVLAVEPESYEARLLQAEAYLEEAALDGAQGRAEEAIANARRAIELAEEAAQFGRSDPRVARASLRAHHRWLNQLANHGGSPAEVLSAIAVSVAQAQRLDPDDPVVLVLQADSLIEQLGFGSATLEEEARMADEALALLRRAVELDGGQVATLTDLAFAAYSKAFVQQKRGIVSMEPVEEGLEASRRASAKAPWDPKPFLSRSWLHAIEAEILTSLGRPSEPAVRRALEASEGALRRGIRDGSTVRRDLGEMRVRLAQEAWQAGGDPRPELEAGLNLLDQALRDRSRTINNLAATAFGHGVAAELLFAMGLDAEPPLRRAISLFEEALRVAPENPELRGHQAECWTLLAFQQAQEGVDPRAAVAEATTAFKAVLQARAGSASFELDHAVLPLFEAQWRRSRGADPRALLAPVELAVGRFVARHPDEPGRALEVLARCALERALFQGSRGRDTAAAARQGLTWTVRALAKEPRNPALWALKARLQLLAGDRGDAKESLDRAWAINALSRNGVESRLAEQALDGQVTPRTVDGALR